MLKQLIQGALERPVAVVVASLAVVVLGFASLLQLPVSLLPALERPQLLVVARDDDRSREALSSEVAEVLEQRLLALGDVVATSSLIDDGVARIEVLTDWQTDVDRLRMDAERQLAELDSLGLDELTVSTSSGDREAVMELAIVGGAPVARTDFVRLLVMPELARIPGVGVVRRTGGARQSVAVRPIASALVARGLTSHDVVQAVVGVGDVRPLGVVRDGEALRAAVVNTGLESLRELGDLRVRSSGGASGRGTVLREVARVELDERPDEGTYLLNGSEAVLLELFRTPGANAVRMARAVRETVDEIQSQGPQGVRLEIVEDASVNVISALRELAVSALLGLGLGTLILRILLGSWGPTLSLMVVVPASIVAAFGMFLVWDVPLDLVSLAGLALALGMLVDNAIVVLEAIAAHRAKKDEAGGSASDGTDSVAAGTLSVALALVASLLTTAAVFVPLIYLRGLARPFFGVQAFAIVSALAISLALSLTLTPILARRVHRAGQTAKSRQPGRDLYLRLLAAALGRPLWFSFGSVLVAAAVIVLALQALERELVPRGEGRGIEVSFGLGGDLEERAAERKVAEIGTAVEDAMAAGGAQTSRFVPRIDVGYRSTRLDDLTRTDHLGDSGRSPDGWIRIRWDGLESGSSRVLADRVSRALARLPGVTSSVELEHALFAKALLRLSGAQLIEVSASTRERSEALAQRTVGALREQGLEARVARLNHPRSSWSLDWDTPRLAKAGLTAQEVEAAARSALGGFLVGHLDLPQGEVEVRIEETLATELELIPIASIGEDSAEVQELGGNRTSEAPSVMLLGAAARLQLVDREAPWQRSDARPAQSIVVESAGLTPGAEQRQTAAALAGLSKAPDERVRLVGSGAELARSFEQLRLTLALAIVLVFLTVAALYESIRLPLAVAATIPIASAGALLALLITGQSLNVMSFLGVILLVGIVVNNSIVLLGRAEDGRLERPSSGESDGSRLVHVALEAAGVRYRPILMTTLTTLLSMVPLAVLGGEGLELRRALATAVIGGLGAGAVASLFVVPALYVVLADRRPAKDQAA